MNEKTDDAGLRSTASALVRAAGKAKPHVGEVFAKGGVPIAGTGDGQEVLRCEAGTLRERPPRLKAKLDVNTASHFDEEMVKRRAEKVAGGGIARHRTPQPEVAGRV